ncbi:hypothetical protein RISK_004066 [Rhodopirellula islandica]|uniref:Uncharacterized protein n=1 Tax=Rhodopirellula islandica TaxID=595434 RepID=A0A0J1EDN8_RHOIS|nr:hypothetical protein RISK_004066 [Rhodopirellula islandica]
MVARQCATTKAGTVGAMERPMTLEAGRVGMMNQLASKCSKEVGKNQAGFQT